MRRIAIAAAVGVCISAAAAGPADLQPEARAYVNLSFDGQRAQSAALFYGLRVDAQRYAAEEAAPPPMAQLEFDRHGFLDGRVNGMPFMQRLALHDDDGGSTDEGGGHTYSALDWGLIVLGVAGVGFAIAEVAGGDNSPDPANNGGGTTGTTGTTTGTTGGLTGGGIPCLPPPLPQLPGCVPLTGGAGGIGDMPGEARATAQYTQWLDGGTGHMGDLVAH